jgi:hypothetical protein
LGIEHPGALKIRQGAKEEAGDYGRFREKKPSETEPPLRKYPL